MASEHLERILARQNRTTTLKVVFVDVVSYSKRRSQAQADVIDAFMKCLEAARKATAQRFVEYSEANHVNFQKDLIFLPSGDGAAIAFPFEGLHDVHLFFAQQLLSSVHEHNSSEGCEKFKSQGWCHCHGSFNLAIGVSDGKGILYKDINGNYNVAGTVINMAARVMNLAGPKQIIFTEDAYRQLIDMVDDPQLDERFREFKDARIKHNLKITVYQYCEPGLDYLDCAPPEDLNLTMKASDAMAKLSALGFPVMPDVDVDKKKLVAMIEAMAQGVAQLQASATPLEAGFKTVEHIPD